MVGRLREKQHQLAAQKQNEAFVKYNHCLQTARYFERECEIAKHYDSWNFRDLDAKKQLQAAKKTERLLVRRKKLKALLKEEEQIYKRELEQLKARKDRAEPPSLEALKEKLKERRAEQGLYLPRTCRRYQSYFVYPTDSVASHLSSFRNSDSPRSRVCRDFTNFPSQYALNPQRRNFTMNTHGGQDRKEHGNIDMDRDAAGYSSRDTKVISEPNPKFLERYSRKSLENTNVRTDELEDEAETPDRTEGGDEETTSDVKENRSSHDVNHKDADKSSADTPRPDENETDKQPDETKSVQSVTASEIDEADRCEIKEKNSRDTFRKEARSFEKEKNIPWLRMDPHDKNLSKQMFLYLTHKELKTKIEDLSRRELHACNKQSWDEALRLRDMRNRLELIREKRLYNMEDLEMDEEARKQGLTSIDKREEELAEREHACADSTMYSEEAKALWKKWVREDEQSSILDARAQRETLMLKLEEEWQGLAIRDKDKISESFRDSNSDPYLQEENKLSAAISRGRVKSASGRQWI